MRRVAALLFVMQALGIFAASAEAAAPQIQLDHKLVTYSKSANGLALDYTLHIVNPGNSPLTDLSLTLVPLPPLSKRATVKVEYVAPHGSAEVPVVIEAPAVLDGERFSKIPLFWAGSYLDPDGKGVEFPAKSTPGGAK